MTTHAVSHPTTTPLGADELARIDAWWRAANYLSVGQIYLHGQPAAARAAEARAREAAAARPLGHHPGAQLHLRPSQPGDRASATST